MIKTGNKATQVFNKTLTDVERGVYLSDWIITNEEFEMDDEWMIDKRRLEGGVSDGIDVITVDNGDLSFTLIPTRGMSIWKGEFKGTHLGWDSPVRRLVHPHYINLETRRGITTGFNEWIMRCGLTDFPGRIANIPGEAVKVRVTSGSTLELEAEGVVYERAFFGPNLKMTTLTSTTLKSNTIHVKDVIENLKSTPEEMQLLYHCNYGPPFLEDGAHVMAPFKAVAPRDPRSAEGIENFDAYGPPESGFTEQVYFCKLVGDDEGRTKVALINRGETKGVSISFSLKELPYFTIWKNTNTLEEGYVTGLEPATGLPNIRTFEREHNRVVNLKPKGRYGIELDFSAHLGKDKVQKLKSEIENLKGGIKPKIFEKPNPDYSPV